MQAEDDVMKQIKFSIPGSPFGKQRPRVVNRGKFSKAYTPKETVSYENLVKLCYQETAKGNEGTGLYAERGNQSSGSWC